MEPVISALSEKYQEEMVFMIIDVEKYDDPSVRTLAKEFNIQYVPTIILVDSQGKMVKRHVGLVSEEELTKEIDQLLE